MSISWGRISLLLFVALAVAAQFVASPANVLVGVAALAALGLMALD